MPLDFIKIDGALVQDLAGNFETQTVVKKLVEQAGKLKIETIAERVEDANTMAVLWQLGVQFIQGYFVNAPEEVTITEARLSGRSRRRPRRTSSEHALATGPLSFE